MSIYIGIDWSQDRNDVAFMNAVGAIIARLTIYHQPDGFHKLETTRQQLAVTAADCLVGLETAHNLRLPPASDTPLGLDKVYPYKQQDVESAVLMSFY